MSALGSPLLTRVKQRLDQLQFLDRRGRVTEVMPNFLRASGPSAPVGTMVHIEPAKNEAGYADRAVLAEVSRCDERQITMMPFGAVTGIAVGSEVTIIRQVQTCPVGPGFWGRIVDPLGAPLDRKESIVPAMLWPLEGPEDCILDRSTTQERLVTGIRAIDGLRPLAQGQRVGILASSGVGKSVLVSMLTQKVKVDRVVICLVGERGREVQAYWEQVVEHRSAQEICIVAATSDQPAILRVRAVYQALALAEAARAQGEHVALVVDSITRFAMALREVGLAAGEPATLRAYPPSVFARLPAVVERCGARAGAGSITALMTVLTENEQNDDPLAETMKSILDGHFILSRTLADLGHFPAIDCQRSVSRLAERVMTPEHQRLARLAVSQLAVYESSRLLIEAGAYSPGANPQLDEAMRCRSALLDFLQQPQTVTSRFEDTLNQLALALQERKAS